MRVEFAGALPHDTSFVRLITVSGTGADRSEYVGRYWMPSLWSAVRLQQSLYYHGGGSLGVYRMDPYYSWLISLLGRHFKYFDRVIKPEDM
jgi:hypothetical protein